MLYIVMSNTESNHESTVRYEISKPYGNIGMRTTEGQRVLNALHILQQKLNSKPNQQNKSIIKLKSNISMNASGDQFRNTNHIQLNKSTNTCVIDDEKPNNSGKLIEKRLELIEKQLESISHLVSHSHSSKLANNPNPNPFPNHYPNPYPTPSPSVVSSKDERQTAQTLNQNNHKLVDNSAQTTDEKHMKSIPIAITKSKSTEFIDKAVPNKHFHLNSKDIPFILGTCSKSHSVIAKKQLLLSKLKQHNRLCEQKPARKLFNDNFRSNDAIDHEIKELLYDLQEEHNYICDEIQHLTKQMEAITDTQKKQEFQRELYFLSRRIIAKKKQINELQQLHSMIRNNKTCFHQTNDNFVRKKEMNKCLSADRLIAKPN